MSINLLLHHFHNQINVEPVTQSIIMCRGFQGNDRDSLKIRGFFTHLSCTTNADALPDSLTLHFLPRIDAALLQINGSTIRPDSPAFLTLHRILSDDVKYGSRDRVTVCEGARFEIFLGDVKVLKGIFRKDVADNWKMECKCVLSANGVVRGLQDAEVAVAAEGLGGVMTEKMEMVAAAERRRRRGRCCEMEEIPEVREEESGGCCCSECGGREADGAGDCETEEVNVEAVRWAVDVGIWAVCLGVGYLVSASSFKRLRRKRFI